MPKPYKMEIPQNELVAELELQCFDYLGSLGITIWGQSWNIYESGNRKQAADWLARTILEVMKHYSGRGLGVSKRRL